MKRVKAAIVLYILSSTVILGQWTTQNSGTTNNLTSINFISANAGWAVGASGLIITTTNGGTNWNAQTSGTTNQLNSVSFAGSLNGIIVGNGGKILMTSDGGLIWQSMTSGVTSDLFGVRSISTSTAIAVGDLGKILKTTNGGISWTSKVSGTTDVLWSVFFTDANTGWAVGGNYAFGRSTILKTINGGENWTAQTSPTSQWLYSVSFSDSQHGWAVGPNGTIVATTNGGTNWFVQPSGELWEWFYGCYAASGSNVWVGGGSGLVKGTTNGGTNWTTEPTGITNALRSFSFIDSNTGWAAGDGGKILKYSSAPSGAITITTPNGGENWQVGTSQNITWTSTGVTNVKIEYTTNNGTSWSTVIASVSSTPASYSWQVPNTPTGQGKVRVSDASNALVNSVGASTFIISVPPSVTVTSPNGGENWQVGTVQNITWTTSNVNNVKLEYTTNSGTSWSTIVESTASTPASYSWTIPNTPTVQGKVRVSDAGNAAVNDVSDNVFIILSPKSITLTSPNGNEKWKLERTYDITWISSQVQNVKIEYSSNNGNSWIELIGSTPAASRKYRWGPLYNFSPEIIRKGLIRVTDLSDNSVSDQSDSEFSILRNTIPIISSVQGRTVRRNEQIAVSVFVTDQDGDEVTLSHEPLPPGALWDGYQFKWTPTASDRSGNYDIVFIATDGTSSPVYYTLVIKVLTDGTMRVTSPISSRFSPKSFRVGKPMHVTWESTNVNNVKIEYQFHDTDDLNVNVKEGPWKLVTESTPATPQSFDWNVPDDRDGYWYRLKISDANDAGLSVMSGDFNFYRANIVVTSPNGGESWTGGTNHNITWTSLGPTNVKIEYTTNNGTSWSTIVESVSAATGSYSWTVPNAQATQAKVRVSDVSDGTLNDVSDNVFAISIRAITLISPNGGEKIPKNMTTTIKWVSNYSTLLSIDYSTDSGLLWVRIADNINAGLGKYDWIVPDVISSNCLIRISDQNNPLITDKSDHSFSIQKGSVTLINPNGGDYLLAGNKYLIRWTSINVPLVKIFYSIDNGSNWQLIDNASGFLVWNVPMVLTKLAKIKIEDATNKLISDVSDSVFTICHLNLLSPNGGESWSVNTNHKIKWESVYLTSPVKLEYSPDDANSWYTIASNIKVSDSSYLWNMNIQSGYKNKVRISSMLSSDVKTQSAANFTTYMLKLVSPKGGEKFKKGDQVNINWISDKNIDHLTLDFSSDKGNSWNTISYMIRASEKSYNWTVPDKFSDKCLIRIADNLNQNISAISDSTFSIIRPDITIIEPQADTFYTTGSAALIRWRSTDVQFVRLTYLVNDSGNWKIIADSVDARLGEYYWHFPDTAASFRVLVSDINSSARYMSPGSINSIRGNLHLKNPNGGEYLKTGSTSIIYWNSVSVDKINILIGFLENGNYRWVTIANLIEARLNAYYWTIPNNIQGNAKIRIEDAANPNSFDESDGVFSLSRISILTPTENQMSRSGHNLDISWNNSVGKVNIDYSTDAGNNWTNIISNYTSSRNTYSFNFRNIQSRNCLVRISDSTDTIISKKFIVYYKQFEVVFPSRTRVRPGSEIAIQLFCYEDIHLKIEIVSLFNPTTPTTALERDYYSRNTPYNYSFFIPLNTTVPSFSINVTGNSLWDPVSKTINIIKLDLDPNLPVQILKSNSTFRINWTSQNIDKVKLEYSTDGGTDWITIADSIQSNLLKYDWTVPNIFSQDCLIRITDKRDSEIYSICRAPFAIVNAPFARIEKPIDRVGVRLEQNKIYSVKWKTSSIDTFNIEQSNDNGNSWSLLFPKVASAKDSISWQVTTMPTNDAKLRIVDPRSNNKFESKSFSIISGPMVGLTNLSDKINLFAKQEFKIAWLSKNLSTLKLEYRLKPSLPWDMINPSFRAADSGFCYWTPPDLTTDSLEVKITSIDFSYITHSIQNIKIVKRPLRIVSPNGFESYQANSRIEVSWVNTNAGLIKIYISQDYGETWSLLASRVDATKNKTVINLPQLSSSRCLLKISSYNDSNVLDVSDTTFSIWQSSVYKWKKVSNNLRPNSETSVGNLTFLNNSTGLVNKYFSHVTVSVTYVDIEGPIHSRMPVYSYSGTSEAQILQTKDGGFSWQPVLTLNDFRTLSFLTKIDEYSAIVISKKDSIKTIYTTNNEGDSWQSYPLQIDADIKKIVFNGAQDGWIFAEKNGQVSLYKSTDTGKHWTQISANISIASTDINDIKFLSSTVGWIVGNNGFISKTMDGGLTWVRINLSSNQNFTSIAFNGSYGLIVGSGGVRFKTTNSGNTWIQLSSGITVDLSDLQLISSLDIWAFGNNSSWHSTDGGTVWTSIQIPYSGNFYNLTNAGPGAIYSLGTVQVGSDYKVCLYRYGDNFLKLVDPRNNDQIQLGIPRSISWDCGSLTSKVKIQLLNNTNIVYESGEISGNQKTFDFTPNITGKLLKVKLSDAVDPLTSDSAIVSIQRFDPNSSWTEIDSTGIIDLVTFDQTTAYMRNRNGVYVTNNSGSNWSPVSHTKNVVGHYFLNKQTFFILDAFTEYIMPNPLFESGLFDNRILYKFRNQGQGSEILYSTRNQVVMNDLIFSMDASLFFINESVGWMRMTNNNSTSILSTRDGGTTWQNSNISPDKMFFIDTQTGFNYTSSSLRRTTDAGVNWSDLSFSLSGINFKDIFFSSLYIGWIAGSYYDPESSRGELLIIKTTNGGGRWQQVQTNIAGEIESIHFINNIGYISVRTNDSYSLYKSTDNGQNWVLKLNNIKASNMKVRCFSENLIYLYGDDLFAYSTNGGEMINLRKISNDDVQLPKEYKLSQNYPNPFNPVTTINYTLPKDSRVVVRIYNILGEQVSELVNEVQPAGYYYKQWNAGNYSSGVYLLRIETESLENREKFVKTVKMLLLK